MPDVYQAGALVPDLDGLVNGAATVILHRREEIDVLLALCELAGTPPEDPMLAVYRELSKGVLDGQAWLWWKQRLGSRTRQGASEGEKAPIDRLADALTLAKLIWDEEGDKLSLAFSIADPSAAAYPELEIETAVPVFALRPGSLTASILKGRFKAVLFSICLFTGGGATAYARAENLVEKMRKEALGASSIALGVLRDVTAADLADNQGNRKMLVVLVHGLLSTDARHFDALIRRLDKSRFVVAGFPHNTLTEIEGNARELARDLSAAIGERPNPVGLVCHSRGGLVARLAAEYLYEDDQKKKREFWKNGLRICVTFGTPHLGSDLAESPAEFIATFVAQASLSATRRAASLFDVLAYRIEHDGFPGIEDLKPGSKFLRKLEAQEQGVSPNIPIVSFGGRAQPGGAGRLLADRVFGTSEHDMVVRLKSSLPSFLPAERRIQTNCNHFGYFEEWEDPILKRVEDELEKAFARESAEDGAQTGVTANPTTMKPSGSDQPTDYQRASIRSGPRRTDRVKPPEGELPSHGSRVIRGVKPPTTELD